MASDLERLRNALGDRYDIEQEIGAGGMATVYRARDLKHDRLVAVKVLRPELAATLGPDRFPREIRIVAQLSHPHILPLHDSGEADGFLYYVMPFVEGESLRTKIERDGELPVHEATRLISEIVDALAYAHQHGVVHRDIKPDNIMLSGRHAVVMDFGVAKAVSQSASSAEKLTTVGIALGTPMYMAPEQAMGERLVDHRADIYAVGILAYEMLTGQPPFGGQTAQAVLAAHVTKEAEPVTARRATVPKVLEQIIMRCLEKKPADRWQTAQEMIPYLEQAATPSGGITPTDTRPIKVTPIARNRRWFVGAGAMLAIAGVAGWLITAAIGGGGGIERVAVLPLHNLSGQETELFADGLHDALVTGLARLGSFTVTSRASVMRYKVTEKTIRQIGDELGVDAILEGTVLRAGNRVRINAQLVNADNDQHLWAQSYEREMSDELALQQDIVDAIAKEIQAAFTDSTIAIGALPAIDLRRTGRTLALIMEKK
ncbi:MAG TPA: serine/threonine-protein kinase [Gemmatimonadales bacterium]